MGYNEYDELVSVDGLDLTGATGTVRFAYDIAGQSRGALGHALLTGLSPNATTNLVGIPGAAVSAFRNVIPIGPYSALKAVGHVHFSAPGIINLATGAFTQTGSFLLPHAAVYGPDVLIYGASFGAYGLSQMK
jgi:hypothetical protein